MGVLALEIPEEVNDSDLVLHDCVLVDVVRDHVASEGVLGVALLRESHLAAGEVLGVLVWRVRAWHLD